MSNKTPEVKQSEGRLDEARANNETYRVPKVIAIGKAIDLLQGGQGKHTDGSSGYYWDQEG